MTDILWRLTNIIQRVQYMDPQSLGAMAGYGILLVFGILNCILGYRLLRFWMMLFGFILGGVAGFAAAYTTGVTEQFMYIAAVLAGGILLALLAFLIYKVGIFVIGAGIGMALGIYILHPTTSFIFFLCILIGVGLGVLAMRYVKGVLIVGTSLLGGVLSGYSLAQLGNLPQLPIGVAMIVAFAILGMLIQFTINRQSEDDEDEEDYEESVKEKDDLPEIQDVDEYLEDMMERDREWEEQRRLRRQRRRAQADEEDEE